MYQKTEYYEYISVIPYLHVKCPIFLWPTLPIFLSLSHYKEA